MFSSPLSPPLLDICGYCLLSARARANTYMQCHTYTYVHLHTSYSLTIPFIVQERKKKEEARRLVQVEELRRARKEDVRRVRQQYREDFAVEEGCDFVRTLSAGGGARHLSLNALVSTMRDGTTEKERRSG